MVLVSCSDNDSEREWPIVSTHSCIPKDLSSTDAVMLIDFNHSLSSLDTLDWIQIYACIRLFFVFLPTTYYHQQTSQDHNFYSNPDSEEADEDKDLHLNRLCWGHGATAQKIFSIDATLFSILYWKGVSTLWYAYLTLPPSPILVFLLKPVPGCIGWHLYSPEDFTWETHARNLFADIR